MLLRTACLAALTLTVATAARAADTHDLTLAVTQGGDVKWQGDCMADILDAGGAVASSGAVTTAFQLAPGKYTALLRCPSTEGEVKQSVAVTIGNGDVKSAVTIAPGFLLVNVVRYDSPVSAEVSVLDERNQEVARGRDKAILVVPAGKHKVVARVDDAKAGHPVLGNAAATVTTKQKTTVSVDTTDGKLQVTLLDNGKPATGVAALRLPGQATRLVEIRTNEDAQVPPGTYDLVTQLDGAHDFAEVVTKGVTIAPNKSVKKTVSHRTGTVTMRALIDGKTPPADAKIDVDLYLPGGTQPFNTANISDALKLSPQKIRLVARRTDQKLDDGSEPTAEATTQGSGSVTFDLSAARLDVTTTIGKKPASLDVDLRVPGADAPVAQKTTDDKGKATFLVAAGRYTVTVTKKAPQGDVVTKKDVTLKRGNDLGAALDLNIGSAVVQVFDGGIAVPAEVRFYERLQDGKPDGDAVLSVPAGQEAFIPPGAYALVVVRKGTTHVFSEIKVAAGVSVERTVDLKPDAPTEMKPDDKNPGQKKAEPMPEGSHDDKPKPK